MFLCKSAWVIAQTMSHISVRLLLQGINNHYLVTAENVKEAKLQPEFPEMLGCFLNLNKMQTKRLSNHISQ